MREHALDDEGSDKEEGEGGKAVVTAIKVVGDKEGKGNKEGIGTGKEGGVPQRGQW